MTVQTGTLKCPIQVASLVAGKRLLDGGFARILTSKIHPVRWQDRWWFGIPPDKYPDDSFIWFRLRDFFDDDDGVMAIPLNHIWRSRIESASPQKDGYVVVHIRRRRQELIASIFFGRVEEGEWRVDVKRWSSMV